jgi:uncharacterized protein (DUF2267 family)
MQPGEASIEPGTGSQRWAGQRLAPDTDIRRSVTAVLKVLAQRLSGGKAQQLEPALGGLVPLPECNDDVLQDLLFRCTQEREEEATRFGEVEFLEALGAELGLPSGDAERVSVAVFDAVREVLPQDQLKRIASRLPKPLTALWSGGAPGRSS